MTGEVTFTSLLRYVAHYFFLVTTTSNGYAIFERVLLTITEQLQINYGNEIQVTRYIPCLKCVKIYLVTIVTTTLSREKETRK